MKDVTDEDLRPRTSERASHGRWGFAAGLLVGLAGAIAGIALAVAAERRRRRLATTEASTAPSTGVEESDDWHAEDAELDEELAQTFPASDPLPQSHRVD